MPRAPIPRGNFYHVVLRGSRRETLFSTPADRRALNSIAKDAMRKFGALLHAYCLMPNQFRFLVQSEESKLIKALQRITLRYTRYRQKSSLIADDLFERPYDAKRIETRVEFLTLLRSIHLTPVTTNSVVAPDDYLWSSHRAYLGFKSVAQITTEFGLSLLATNLSLARVAYYRFINEGVSIDVKDGTLPGTHVFPLPEDRLQEASSGTKEEHRAPKARIRIPRLRRGKRLSTRRHLSIY